MPDFSLWRRAQDSIAQGALTNSKHPERHVYGVYPTHAYAGYGASLITPDGVYQDYICGLGANLFGYNNPKILEAIQSVINKGFSHSLPTVYEVEAAEKLKEIFYFVAKWKFLKTGSEACSAAIKMARAYTGRDLVLSDGYHGWSDGFTSLTEPALGVHKDQGFAKLCDDARSLKDVAAVIIEPVITDWSDERRAWLQALRDRCTKAGTLLIFDEVITGFRFPKYCVAQYFNIIPDLIVIGKTIAGGLPLAAVGGKAEVMDGNYFVSSTYAGEILSLAACKRAGELLESDHSYNIDQLWEAGQKFITRFNRELDGFLMIKGYPTRGVFEGPQVNKALFFQEAAKAKMLFCNSWFYNWKLMDNDYAFFEFLKDFKANVIFGRLKLEGKLPLSPFADQVRKTS